jgi:hypothetical protein
MDLEIVSYSEGQVWDEISVATMPREWEDHVVKARSPTRGNNNRTWAEKWNDHV